MSACRLARVRMPACACMLARVRLLVCMPSRIPNRMASRTPSRTPARMPTCVPARLPARVCVCMPARARRLSQVQLEDIDADADGASLSGVGSLCDGHAGGGGGGGTAGVDGFERAVLHQMVRAYDAARGSPPRSLAGRRSRGSRSDSRSPSYPAKPGGCRGDDGGGDGDLGGDGGGNSSGDCGGSDRRSSDRDDGASGQCLCAPRPAVEASSPSMGAATSPVARITLGGSPCPGRGRSDPWCSEGPGCCTLPCLPEPVLRSGAISFMPHTRPGSIGTEVWAEANFPHNGSSAYPCGIAHGHAYTTDAEPPPDELPPSPHMPPSPMHYPA